MGGQSDMVEEVLRGRAEEAERKLAEITNHLVTLERAAALVLSEQEKASGPGWSKAAEASADPQGRALLELADAFSRPHTTIIETATSIVDWFERCCATDAYLAVSTRDRQRLVSLSGRRDLLVLRQLIDAATGTNHKRDDDDARILSVRLLADRAKLDTDDDLASRFEDAVSRGAMPDVEGSAYSRVIAAYAPAAIAIANAELRELRDTLHKLRYLGASVVPDVAHTHLGDLLFVQDMAKVLVQIAEDIAAASGDTRSTMPVEVVRTGRLREAVGALARSADQERIIATTAKPLDMILRCPCCNMQHVDAPDESRGWNNPPHRSHRCLGCAYVWRPADVATNGVERIATRGEKDSVDEEGNEQVCVQLVAAGRYKAVLDRFNRLREKLATFTEMAPSAADDPSVSDDELLERAAFRTGKFRAAVVLLLGEVGARLAAPEKVSDAALIRLLRSRMATPVLADEGPPPAAVATLVQIRAALSMPVCVDVLETTNEILDEVRWAYKAVLALRGVTVAFGLDEDEEGWSMPPEDVVAHAERLAGLHRAEMQRGGIEDRIEANALEWLRCALDVAIGVKEGEEITDAARIRRVVGALPPTLADGRQPMIVVVNMIRSAREALGLPPGATGTIDDCGDIATAIIEIRKAIDPDRTGKPLVELALAVRAIAADANHRRTVAATTGVGADDLAARRVPPSPDAAALIRIRDMVQPWNERGATRDPAKVAEYVEAFVQRATELRAAVDGWTGAAGMGVGHGGDVDRIAHLNREQGRCRVASMQQGTDPTGRPTGSYGVERRCDFASELREIRAQFEPFAASDKSTLDLVRDVLEQAVKDAGEVQRLRAAASRPTTTPEEAPRTLRAAKTVIARGLYGLLVDEQLTDAHRTVVLMLWAALDLGPLPQRGTPAW